MPKLTKQQIVILSVMALVVVYGIYDFFIAPRSKKVTVDTRGTAPKTESLLMEITADVTKEKLSPFDIAAIGRAESVWRADPFFNKREIRDWLSTKEPLKAGSVDKQVIFNYSGYIKVKDKIMAVINGVEYEAGEALETEGFILKKIYRSKVLIENVKSGSKLEIMLQE